MTEGIYDCIVTKAENAFTIIPRTNNLLTDYTAKAVAGGDGTVVHWTSSRKLTVGTRVKVTIETETETGEGE